MKFIKLKLHGFKSFVDHTDFAIEEGLTGIVGPNGCGKSNLVEAMRWVMGENSYKNMRASGMDDVIFSGSGNRPSRNTAEVGLFLNNEDRSAPAAFNDSDELQVTRRIERESGSSYKINGKDARAKDVQLLFADASTGARSPSMVGQGRIGELIQAKPQARRQLLEEAAGISGLHSRRHEAELRMRAAETNLERLDDVTSELESQIESLKRQARQARRFKNISSEIREQEATLFHIRWLQTKENEAACESELSKATNFVAEMAQKQMEAAKTQAISAHKLPELRENLAKAGATLQHFEINRTQLEDEAERLAKRRFELDQRLQQLLQDITREEQIFNENNGVLEQLVVEEGENVEAINKSGEDAVKRRAAYEIAQNTLTQSEQNLNLLTAEKASNIAKSAQLQNTLDDIKNKVMRFETLLQHQTRELNDIAEKLMQLPNPKEKLLQVEQCVMNLAAFEKSLNLLELQLEELRIREDVDRVPVQQARSRLNEIETESRTIMKMLSAGSSGDSFPAIVEKIKVTRGYESALGAALGEDIEQSVDQTAPAYWANLTQAYSDDQLPVGAQPLSNFVEAPVELTRRLAQIGVVEEALAQQLHDKLKAGQMLVTKQGSIWRWDGFVASSNAPTPAAIRLEQKNRLAELELAAVRGKKNLTVVEETQRKTREEIATILANVQEDKNNVSLARQSLNNAREAAAKAERDAGQFSSRKAVLIQSKESTQKLIEELRLEESEINTQILSSSDINDIQSRLDKNISIVATNKGHAAQTRGDHESLSREIEARQRRLEAIHRERANWLMRADNAKIQINILKTRSIETTLEKEKISDAPEVFEAQKKELLSKIANAQNVKTEYDKDLQLAENSQRVLDKESADAIATLSSSRENRGRCEERLAAAKERRLENENRIREVLRCSPHQAFAQAGLNADEALPAIGAVEKKLERAKIERERLGAVNLRAEEEQKELSERLETIIAERGDIIEAIGKLRSAILSLNKQGRKRLLVAFQKVDEQFRRLFTHLFGGGSAELQLIESDDPLEAGLEILARPPGKKPQTMTLLSGGEQALTAMALIFAVFLTNPAPICVLDEVDAPLDDHNVERFCNLMDEMSATTDTRFVIITHNPITMSRMDRLFGVTMAEQGVSQLVSVDLQAAEVMLDVS